jgi:hypothetical protein
MVMPITKVAAADLRNKLPISLYLIRTFFLILRKRDNPHNNAAKDEAKANPNTPHNLTNTKLKTTLAHMAKIPFIIGVFVSFSE